MNMYKQILQSTIQAKDLQAFFPPNDSRLDQAAAVAADHIDQVCIDWLLPKEMGQDLTKLALFDVVIYIDNSGSMLFAKDGQRIRDLRTVLKYVVGIVKLFDSDGLSIRFMNDPGKALDNVKDEKTINEVLNQPGLFHGTTPLGTQLHEQIVKDIVRKAQTNSLPKPVLVIGITDGKPEGEHTNALNDAIAHAKRYTSNTIYGSGAVSFEFAQVGEDENAHEFFDQLDNDPEVGMLVDCTSSYEQEDEQMRKTTGYELTPQLWILKLLLGAIDSSYDAKDEKKPPRPDPQRLGNAPPPYSAPGASSQQQTGYQAYGSPTS